MPEIEDGWTMKLNEIRDNRGRALPQSSGVGRGIGSGKGKTSGARRQGPDRAHRRRAERLRGRPDAAPPPPAQARLQQHAFRKDYPRRQSRPPAGGARGRPARGRAHRRRRGARRGRPAAAAAATACGSWPRASSRRRSRSRSRAPRRPRSRRSRRLGGTVIVAAPRPQPKQACRQALNAMAAG